ncbi:MAG: hypothetical protein ACI89Z_001204 [Porticoccus sp.]
MNYSLQHIGINIFKTLFRAHRIAVQQPVTDNHSGDAPRKWLQLLNHSGHLWLCILAFDPQRIRSAYRMRWLATHRDNDIYFKVGHQPVMIA